MIMKETRRKILFGVFACLLCYCCYLYFVECKSTDVDDTEHLWRGDNGIEFYE